jgi:hypothetical protein
VLDVSDPLFYTVEFPEQSENSSGFTLYYRYTALCADVITAINNENCANAK